MKNIRNIKLFLQIDISAIQVMEETTLQRWIPRYGDRLALRDYCRKQLAPKKMSLIERLRERVRQKNLNIATTSNVRAGRACILTNKKSRKNTRKIEIGWMCSNEKNELVHVRLAQGGGTRQCDVDKTATGYDILEKARYFFFQMEFLLKVHWRSFQWTY